jgi:flagellar biosynthesis protein FlhF
MRIKSFYAGTVEAAVSLARRELGPDAMLVQSRKAPAEARHLGEYEVVCALVPESGEATHATAEEPTSQQTRLAHELAALRKQLDSMGKTITRSAWSAPRGGTASPALSEAHARLMTADVDGELAHHILYAAQQGAPHEDSSESLAAAVRAELERRILVNPVLTPGDGPRIAALVGPPGGGKTTTLVKLAITHGLTARRPLALFSMDDYRVGGAEQLRSYAAILGAGFEALSTTSALAQALEEHSGKGLILIDTPGYGPRDIDRAAELARFLASRPGISIHLVLTASTKYADLIRAAERFEIFAPANLVFTGVDAADSFGTAFSLAARCGKPISFLGTGQGIPDDLEAASRNGILSLLWPEEIRAARSAA